MWRSQRCELTGKRVTNAGLAWALDYVNRGTPDYPAPQWGIAPLGHEAPPSFKIESLMRPIEAAAYAHAHAALLRPPSIPTMAVAVARQFKRSDTATAEQALRRIFKEANTYEYVHLAHAEMLGRKSLPPARPAADVARPIRDPRIYERGVPNHLRVARKRLASAWDAVARAEHEGRDTSPLMDEVRDASARVREASERWRSDRAA